jgi:hypothetical protein
MVLLASPKKPLLLLHMFTWKMNDSLNPLYIHNIIPKTIDEMSYQEPHKLTLSTSSVAHALMFKQLCELNPSTHLATMALPYYPHWVHEHSSFKHHLTLNYTINRPLWNRPQTGLINTSIREIPMSNFFFSKSTFHSSLKRK